MSGSSSGKASRHAPTKIFQRIATSSRNSVYVQHEEFNIGDRESLQNLADDPQQAIDSILEGHVTQKFLILPTSRFKRRWDRFLVLVTLYVAIAVPYNMAFTLDYSESRCKGSSKADNACCPEGEGIAGGRSALSALLFA